MRVEYTLAKADWIAFSDYCVEHAAVYRQAIANARVVVFALCVLAALSIGLMALSIWPIVVGVGVGGVWAAVFVPRNIRDSSRQFVLRHRRLCHEGQHLAEALAEGFHTKCDLGDSVLAWRAIDGVVETSDYVFVLLAEAHGYAIPRARITSGDLAGLVAAVRGRLIPANQA